MENVVKPEELSLMMSEAQLQKLKLEIEELKSKCRKTQKILVWVSIIVPSISTLLLIIGFIASFWQVSEGLNKLNAQAQMEYKKTIMEKQLAVYSEAVDVASKIAVPLSEAEDSKNAEARFRQLFHGSLGLVDDKHIKDIKEQILDCLDEMGECESESGRQAKIKDLSRLFATAVKDSLETHWQTGLKGDYKSESYIASLFIR